MTPSRSAHGQIRTNGTSRARIAAAATTAPAGTWCARSGDTPCNSARAPGLDPGHEADQLVEADSRPEPPRHAQPGRVGRGAGQPGEGAERLAGGGHEVGPPGRAQLVRGRPQQVARVPIELPERGQIRSAAVAGRGQVPAGHPPGAQRQGERDVGVLVDAAGQFQRAAADVEDQQPAGAPAEPAAHGEEGQSRLVLPGEDLQFDARRLANPVEDLQTVPRLPDGRGDQGHEARRSPAARGPLPSASCTALSRAFSPSRDSRSSAPTCSARRSDQRSSCIGVGWAPRWASTTSRWTVFDPTSSTPSRMGPVCREPARRRRLVARWPTDPPTRSPSTSRGSGWSSSTRPTPSTSVRADLTWLTSAWTCIFGRGCAGVVEGRPDDGCCSHGAFFTDDDDLSRVTAAVAQLTDEDWQLAPVGPRVVDREGRRRRRRAGVRVARAPAPSTAPACSSTGPGSPAAVGCALHRMALRTGVHPLTTKPDVCWQLPVRREQEHVERPDGTTVLVTSIGEFDRRGWGPGGHDLHWWCTGSPVAHVSPEPLVETYGPELIALLGRARLRRATPADRAPPRPGADRSPPASPVPVELHRRRPAG